MTEVVGQETSDGDKDEAMSVGSQESEIQSDGVSELEA